MISELYMTLVCKKDLLKLTLIQICLINKYNILEIWEKLIQIISMPYRSSNNHMLNW